LFKLLVTPRQIFIQFNLHKMKYILLVGIITLFCFVAVISSHEDEIVYEEDTEYVFESCGCGHDHDHLHDPYANEHEHHHDHEHKHDEDEEDHFHPDLAKRIQILEDKENIRFPLRDRIKLISNRRTIQILNRRIEDWLEDKIDLDILCGFQTSRYLFTIS
jgi:hypothetical protein